MMDELYRSNILSVIVEGGNELLNSFLELNLWDEAFVYTGNQFFGKGVAAPHISGKTIAYRKLDECKLHVFQSKKKIKRTKFQNHIIPLVFMLFFDEI